MSGTSPPPPPLGLPPPQRQVRALRQWPLFVVTGVVLVVCFATWWGFSGMGPRSSSETAPADTGEADATAILKGAPTGNEIRAAYRPGASPFVPVQHPENSAPTPAPLDDDQTEAAIAARKAAWETYYKALADVDQKRRDARLASMAADMDQTTPAGLSAASDGAGGIASMMAAAQPGQPGQQQQSHDFFMANASNPATDYSPFTATNPISRYELKAGDIVTAKLITGINSDSPGLVKAIVSKTVTDHATGMNILIPQGSTLIGAYDTTISYGQTRLITAWQRIIYPPPCDQSLDLGAMAGSDQSGIAGFEDITNNHLGKVFLNALLVSVFGAGIQLSQPPGSALQQYNPIQTGAGAVGQQMAELGQEFARRGLSVPPTEEIRQGFDFTVLVSRDIAFEKPWLDSVCDPIAVAARQ
jgi:type IV secretory pathway VirB10-like protein